MRIAQDKDNAAGLVAAVKELNAMHGFNAPMEITATVKSLPASVDDFV
jgi:mannose-6-phosphate isomerase class I